MRLEHDTPVTAAEWIALATGGELDHARKTALTEWLRESPRNVRDYVELTMLREDMGALPLQTEQVEKWVQDARQASAIPLALSSARVSSALPGRTRRTFGLAAAAALAVAAVGGYLWWQADRYSTGFGEQKILTLADGSVVTLNTNSALKVSMSGERRTLELIQGEAFFRVARDPSRPFEVTAQETTVRALGTQFNVRIDPRATVVSVVDGLVEVRERVADTPMTAVRLGKGEETRIDASSGPVTARRVEKSAHATALRAAAWTRGRVEFDAVPLAQVLEEFQRYRRFDVDIDSSIRDLKLTGSFDAQDPEAALAYIETLPGIVVKNPSPQSYTVRRE